MPKPLIARLSSSHRLACFSLYRALLRESPIFCAAQSGGLKSLIRRRFKTDRSLQSPSQIANGLNAGWAFLDLLRSSARGDADSTERLRSLLESTLKLSESNRALRNALSVSNAPTSDRQLKKAKQTRTSIDKSVHSRRPESKSVFERPLPLSEIKGGKRRVPKFIVGQGIPFLIYSKPLPPSLGRVIGQKSARRAKRWDQRVTLANSTTPLGEHEDNWDSIVSRQGEQEKVVQQQPGDRNNDIHLNRDLQSWSSASRHAEADIARQFRIDDMKSLEMGRRMVDIMKKERALAAQEKIELESRKYHQRASRRAKESRRSGEPNTTTEDDRAHLGAEGSPAPMKCKINSTECRTRE